MHLNNGSSISITNLHALIKPRIDLKGLQNQPFSQLRYKRKQHTKQGSNTKNESNGDKKKLMASDTNLVRETGTQGKGEEAHFPWLLLVQVL